MREIREIEPLQVITWPLVAIEDEELQRSKGRK